MPLYEYQCEQCQCQFEVLVRGDERAECPQCGGGELNRLISVTARPQGADSSLPLCESPVPGSGCGLPQCGNGRCAM